MIYKFTKCESVIAKIMADLNISEKNIRITDIREWIFEAIDKIGAPMQYVKKESGVDGEPLLHIEDFQVPLPPDLQILDGVAYGKSMKGPWIPMRSNTSIFKDPGTHPPHFPDHDPANEYLNDAPDHVHGRVYAHKLPTSQSQIYTVNGMRFSDRFLIENRINEPTYFIKPGWIVTNRKHGFIKLAYKAIATDERGYPLIPDLSSYQEAVYWYVVMKLSFPKFLQGKLGGKGVKSNGNAYTYIQQQWNFYRNQAYAEAMMPTADDMHSIKNDWNKLIPDWESDDTFFKHQGDMQLQYNDYYYGY